MKKEYIPERGDIVYLNFDPSSGQEITKRRPALTISTKIFNEHTGFAFFAPITKTRRGMSIEVDINGIDVKGVALVYQIRSFDFRTRNVEFVEKASPLAIEKALAHTRLILV